MGCNPILERLYIFSIDFNESYIARVIAALTLRYLATTFTKNGFYIVCVGLKDI